MRKTFTLIMAVLASYVVTAQKLVGTYYDYNKIHPKEQYYVNAAGQKNGSYKMYNQNGVVIKEYNYLNGVENGTCNEYAALPGNQRVVTLKSTFKNGQPEGYLVQYCEYDYKTKVQEGRYTNGKKTGLWKEWWCTEIYDDKYWDILKSVGKYKNGEKDSVWTTYHKTGKIESQGNYSDGIQNGEWTTYNEKGQPLKVINYVSGNPDGRWKEFRYNNGVLVECGEYTGYQNYMTSNKKKDGVFENFYAQSGSIYSRGTYKEDNANGTWSFYSEGDSTKPVNSGEFLDGQNVGKWKIYFTKDFKFTYLPDNASYYRIVTFDSKGNVTADPVQDYMITGDKLRESTMTGMDAFTFRLQ